MSDKEIEVGVADEEIGAPITRLQSFAYFHADAATVMRMGEGLELTLLQQSTQLYFQHVTEDSDEIPLSKRTAGVDADISIIEAGKIRLDRNAAIQVVSGLLTALAQNGWISDERLDRVCKSAKLYLKTD